MTSGALDAATPSAPRKREVRRESEASSVVVAGVRREDEDGRGTQWPKRIGCNARCAARRCARDTVCRTRGSLCQPAQGLYDPALDKDSCGVGFIADIKGRKSHKLIEDALAILCNLEHRGAVGADPRAGDGAGILVQIPHKFFAKKAERLGFTPAEARPICRRRAVHAARSGLAAGDPRHLRPDDQARGHDAPRLARGADRQLDARRVGEADRAGAPAGVHRPRQEDQERGRVRAAALHPAQVDVECDLYPQGAQAVRLLPGLHLLPHRRLQGHVPGRSARHLLSRPQRRGLRERARARAPALLHQYLPDLVAGASLPDDRAQRRDQHAARQRQLDGGAAGLGRLRPVRRRHQQALADLL